MITQYTDLPGLNGVYLEDSFVLAINEDQESLTFRLDAVLTPEHPHYHVPRPGEQYCYVAATLTFRQARQIEWIGKTATRYRDANDEEDMGNIDFLNVENDSFHLGGDWGEVRIFSLPPILGIDNEDIGVDAE